jgi:hypothetical protein
MPTYFNYDPYDDQPTFNNVPTEHRNYIQQEYNIPKKEYFLEENDRFYRFEKNTVHFFIALLLIILFIFWLKK